MVSNWNLKNSKSVEFSTNAFEDGAFKAGVTGGAGG
jgi:hypothetical protein